MAKVEDRRETNGIALVRIGSAKKREQDKELAAPKAVLAKLPTDAGQSHIAPRAYQVRCSGGAYWTFAPEETTILKGKKKFKVELKRLHWIDPKGEAKTSVDLFEPDSLPTFDVRRGFAIMGVEGGRILEIDLKSGKARHIEVEGMANIRRQKFYYVTYLGADRVLAQCYADEGPFIQIFDYDGKQLRARFSHRVRGEVAVTKEGALLAGAAKLFVFNVEKEKLVELASFDESHLRMGIHPSGVVRCYNAHGTFEVEIPRNGTRALE